jgi:hypothetical protein
MKLKTRLARLAKTVPKPEPGTGRAPEWFADKVIAFCHHLYTHAGRPPARLLPSQKTSRPALSSQLNNGFSHFFQAHGRTPTPAEFGS